MTQRCLALLLLLGGAVPGFAEVIVAADGSGQFRTVQQAVDAAPANSHSRYVIHIKPGIYKERIVVPHDKPFLRFTGDDTKTTVLTNNLNANMPGPDGKPIGTFRTPTVTIVADDFSAEGLTFENSAGNVGQAVALTILGDRGVYLNCRFLGWQDTLLAQSGRQYFENSYIEGAVDFIFGGSVAWFENTHIHVTGSGYITAASTSPNLPYGYVFSHSRITAATSEIRTDFGRPWRDYASVAFLNTEMTDVVRPAGWNNWGKPEREKTARYSEYGSTGAGASPGARVPWAHQLTEPEAKALTIASVLGGADGWDPKTGTVRRAQRFNASVALAALPKLDYSGVARGADGVLHLAWAAGDKKIGYAESRDGKVWSATRMLTPMAKEDAIDVKNVTLFYDDATKNFLIIWASTIRGNFFQSYQEEVEDSPRLWYTSTSDFQTFTPAKLYFEPGYTVRSGALVRDGTRYILVHEDSRRSVNQLRIAYGNSATGPWGPSSDAFPQTTARRPGIVRAGNAWLVFYKDADGKSAALRTPEFFTFTSIRNIAPSAGNPTELEAKVIARIAE